MALKTVNVVGTLYNPSGSPASGVEGYFVLNKFEKDTGVVVPTSTYFKTEEDGTFSVNVWPNTRGTGSSQYIVRAYIGQAVIFNTVVYIPDVDVEVDIDDVIIEPPYPPVNQALQALIDIQAIVLEIKNYDSSASESAEQALESALNAYNSALLAEDWAIKMDDTVDGVDYSSKYYAIKSEKSNQSSLSASIISTEQAIESSTSAIESQLSADLSKEWATKENEPVEDGNYSSKYYALIAGAKSQVALDAAEEARQYADDSKSHSIESLKQANISAEHAGISIDKAEEASLSASESTTQAGIATLKASEASTFRDISLSASEESTKQATNSYTSATESQISADLSKDWAIKLGDTVDGVEYSAKHYAIVAGQTNQDTLNAVEDARNYANASEASSIESATQAGISTTKANEASISASKALTSEQNSKISEINSANSANDSLEQAGIATTKATEAEASKNNALDASVIAITQATNSLSSAVEAQISEDLSKDWATKLGETVDGTEYSAKHYAIVAGQTNQDTTNAVEEARVSANAALESEQKAKISEDNSATSSLSANESEEMARKWAENPEDIEVETDSYSAKHWANKSKQNNDESLSNLEDTIQAKEAAEAARDQALISETNSKASEESSSVSATTATTKANEASVSASEALSSKNAAFVSETTAIEQAGIASNAATIATTQAGIATTKANESLTSANNAALSTSNSLDASVLATTQATNASASAVQAGLYEDEATTKANEANNSAADALNSKNAAALSALDASESEQNALDSKNKAQEWAIKMDGPVDNGEYSAKYWAQYASDVSNIEPATTSANGLMAAGDKSKLDGIESGAQVNAINSVAGRTGAIVLSKSDVGLSNVDDTSDVNKPISTAVQSALDGKSDTSHNHDDVYLSYTKNQSLTNTQQQQVWDTIGIGELDVDFVDVYINTRGQV